MDKHKYYISGMHCPACEVLIARKVSELSGTHNIICSSAQGTLEFESNNLTIEAHYLDELLKKYNYRVSDKPFANSNAEVATTVWSIVLIIFAIAVFVGLQFSGTLSRVQLNSGASLWGVVLFGLVAGFSTCAALVGGVLLSLTKQWTDNAGTGAPLAKRLIPQLMFNIGRLAGFAGFGALLGLIGSTVKPSPVTSAWLVIGVTILMILLALQMLGVPFVSKIRLLPFNKLGEKVASSANIKQKWIPVIVGLLSFFLPCGFALTAQSYALLQGNPLASSLTMLMFALGTLPALVIIGYTSSSLITNPKFSHIALRFAGVIVLIFALYNINNQLNVLGYPSIKTAFNQTNPTDPAYAETTTSSFQDEYTPPKCACCSTGSAESQNQHQNQVPVEAEIKESVQVVKMQASASGYTPNYFKVKVNKKVRWEIEDVGTSGCTNANIAPKFFPEEIELTHGKTAVKEFTPTKLGKFRFSCWMGMVTGVIEVVK